MVPKSSKVVSGGKRLIRKKRPQGAVESQLATLLSPNSSGGFLSKQRRAEKKTVQATVKKGKKHSVTVVARDNTVREIVAPEAPPATTKSKEEPADTRTPAERIGARLLRRAVRNQSYNRPLEHQQRVDYEYRLRRVATMGVVRLFNALSKSHEVGEREMKEAQQTVTIDKAEHYSNVATKDAFLASLKQSAARAPADVV